MDHATYRPVGWVILFTMLVQGSSVFGALKEREPVTLSVVAANPSTQKTQTVPVRIDLPQEIKSSDVLEKGNLDLEYDDEKGLYYVYKDAVELKPKEVRVFEVTMRDMWFVPDEELDNLKNYTGIVLGRLKETTYYDPAKQLSNSIVKRLEEIRTMQNDETLSRKSQIGGYRRNLQTIGQVKEDLARMEKLLAFTGGPPVPAMLNESPLKADAPSTTTTWLVIFLIVIFIGLLGGQFFFTWQRRTQVGQDLAVVRQVAFGPPRYQLNGDSTANSQADGSNGASPGSSSPTRARPGSQPLPK